MSSFKVYVTAAILSVVVLVGLNSFTIVSTGSEASVESFGQVHEGKNLTGFNLVAPWWGIDEYNLQSRTTTFDNLGIGSQDKFKTQMDVDVTGNFLRGHAAGTRGSTGTAKMFENTHMIPRVKSCLTKAGLTVKDSQSFFVESIQASMSDFTVDCVNEYFQTDKVGGGYQITAVTFSDQRLAKVVQKFIEDTKQRQEQENQQASQLKIADLKSQEIVKKSESNLAAADNNKKAQALVAEAKLYGMQQEAEGNLELSKSITPALVNYIRAKRWDGKLPTHSLGENTMMMVK